VSSAGSLCPRSPRVSRSGLPAREVFLVETVEQGFDDQNSKLKQVTQELESVDEQSQKTFEDSESLNLIINEIMQESAQLKTLSDNFEVILNKRSSQRTIVAPPKECSVTFGSDNKKLKAHIFDISKQGISFYFCEDDVPNHELFPKGAHIYVHSTEEKVDGEYEVVYLQKSSAKRYFLGARKI